VRTLLKELPIVVVIVLGGSYLLKGQRELPLLWGEMLGPMAVCYPLTLEQRLALSQGETLPLLWNLLHKDCTFDPLRVRLPAIGSAFLSLLIGGFALRRKRSTGERFLFTLLLVGTPAFLFYSHVIRPYEYLLLGGTAVWLYREKVSSPIRVVLGTLSMLGVPFIAPLYGSVLLRSFLSGKAPVGKRIRPLLLLEMALFLVVLSWEVGILAVLSEPLLSTWMRERGWESLTLYRLKEAIQLISFDTDLWGGIGFTILVLFAVRSLILSLRDLALLATAGGFTFLALLIFEPQATARFFLGFYPAILDLFIRGVLTGIPPARRAKLKTFIRSIALFFLLFNAVRTFSLYWIHTPEFYRGVELSPPLSEIVPHLRDGDILLVEGSWFLDQLVVPIIIRYQVELWVYPSGFIRPFAEPWLGGTPERWRDFVGLPWTKITRVRIFRSPEDLLLSAQHELEANKRIVSLGFLSAPPHICHEPCPALFQSRIPPLVVVRDQEVSEDLRKMVCVEKAPLMVIAETRAGYELFYPLAPLFPDPGFTKKVTYSLCPPRG